MKVQKLISTLSFLLLLFSAIAQVNPTNTIEKLKDKRAPVDTSWSQLLAGNQLFANSELFNPAGQILNLAQGTRVLNLDLAQHQKFVVVKKNTGITVVSADSFKVISQFDYEKDEAGSMFGLTLDDNDSTIYFTGAKKNLYAGTIDQSGLFTLTKK